jgi:hypothetical protein
MSHVHFVGGEKGGVGKSVVARLLAQYFIDRKITFECFDSDNSNGAMLRFYGEYSRPIAVDEYESVDQVVQAATDRPDERIVVDLAAQTQQPLVRWIDESGLVDLSNDLGIELTYWHVMDAGRDSVDLLKKLLDQFGDRLRLVLVLNEVRGDNFSILDASGQRARAEELGAKIIRIPQLPASSMQKMDAHSSSFWSAVNNTNGTGLGLLERQRVKIWLLKCYERLERAPL